jgi:hypothetical protein
MASASAYPAHNAIRFIMSSFEKRATPHAIFTQCFADFQHDAGKISRLHHRSRTNICRFVNYITLRNPLSSGV